MSTRPVPVATVSLIAMNLAVAYLVAFWPAGFEVLAFDPKAVRPWTPFTSLFVHESLWHLLGNMVFLAAVGPAAEMAARASRFLTVYFVGGLTGVAVFWGFASGNPHAAALVGASGCVAACIAYYTARLVHLHVHLAPKIGASVLAVTILWVVLQGVGAFLTPPSGGGTAYFSHLGGFLVGLLLSFLWKAPADADRQLGHAVIDRMGSHSVAGKLAATDLHLGDHPDDVKALFRKAEALAEMNDHEAEAPILVQLAAKLPRADRLPVYSRLLDIRKAELIPSLERTMAAEEADAPLARRLLLSIVGQDEDARRPDALVALLSMGPEDEVALWRQELASRYPLHPAVEVARARGLL